MKRQRNFIGTVLLLLAVTVVIALIPTEREAAIYEDTVRLHIRARSDSEEDQAVKLQIRDRVLAEYGPLVSGGDIDGARAEIAEHLGDIQRSVDGWLTELGYGYGCEVALGREWFDTREYESFCLPAGEYDSLIISLGGGEGENWWCVMYPPMCLDAAVGAERYTDEERGLVAGGKYRVRFKLLELCADLVRGED